MTSRIQTTRGRPPGLASGSKGSMSCHCSSVKSLGYGFLSISIASVENQLNLYFSHTLSEKESHLGNINLSAVVYFLPFQLMAAEL
jgi:hypothetical protein